MRIVPKPILSTPVQSTHPFEVSLREALNTQYPNSRVDVALIEKSYDSGWILAVNIALPYTNHKPLVSKHIQWDCPTQEECINMYSVEYILNRLEEHE